jgi:hypothetical protein
MCRADALPVVMWCMTLGGCAALAENPSRVYKVHFSLFRDLAQNICERSY